MAQILVHSVLSMKYNIMTKDNSFWSQFCFGHLSLALPLILILISDTDHSSVSHVYLISNGVSKKTNRPSYLMLTMFSETACFKTNDRTDNKD